MKITEVKKAATGAYNFTMVADAAEFEAAVEAAYQAKKPTYTLEGKAQGEATRAEIEEKEGVQFLQFDAVNDLLASEADALLAESFTKEGITPLSQPEYNLTRCDAEGFSLNLKIGVLPEITLGEYKDLTIEYPRLAVPNEENAVSDQIEQLRKRVAASEGPDAPLPELDDAFAQKVAGCASVAELREKMQDSLNEFIRTQSLVQARYLLLEEIGKHCKLEPPVYLLDQEYQSGVRQLLNHLEQNNLTVAQYVKQIGKTEEEFHAINRQSAIRALRGKLAAYTIAKVEGITATPVEVESEIVRLAGACKQTVSDFKAENPAYMVYNDMVLRRTMVFLEQNSKLVEMDPKAAK